MLELRLIGSRSSRSPRRAPESARRSASRRVLDGISVAPTTATEAYECLTAVSGRLREIGDPRAIFPDIYAVVTRRVRDLLPSSPRPFFFEPRFISRLAGRFCELYLRALARSLDGDPERIGAWAAADRARATDRALPIQHVILGLNAHINFDLALGLHANVLSFGGDRDPAAMERYLHDHDAVNEILAEALPEVLSLLADRYGCPAARLLVDMGAARAPIDRVVLFTLARWRTRVWADLLDLLRAPGPEERHRVEARMDRRSRVLARVFSVSTPLRAWTRRARPLYPARS